MAQPEISGTGVGRPVMPYGSDGSNWLALLVDALGRLQVDAEVDNFPADPATQTTLASCLTALQSLQNLVGALHDVGLDELDVQVITSVLPTDAATQTTLAATLTALQSIQNLVGALHDVGLDELDVRVEGFDPVPTDPINEFADGVSAASGTLTTVVSYTVTTAKTLYLTDLFLSDQTGAAGIEFESILQYGAANKLIGRAAAGADYKVHLRTPLKAVAETVITLRTYQWSGVAKNFAGNIIGFEV